MMSDLESIFAVTRADVRAALREEQAELSPNDFEDACLYVAIAFVARATDTITDAVQDFLYEKDLR